jgi:hypothetical protein
LIRGLVGALCFLSLATSASADCARVLWVQERDARLSKAEGTASWAASKAKKPPKFVSFQCLPDTVDPRGPKGK